ncbi:MAG: hypothetical protein JXA91_00710 [Candidatus Thermoplasmatota archaeon]|nr:hypothetical protein [Candidatus Thermoplasmatota archaeon]
MPRLVKGGKYAFGWSNVSSTGRIKIPPEAVSEYNLKTADKLIVISGSKTSGGFSIVKIDKLKSSFLSIILDDDETNILKIPMGQPLKKNLRVLCWTILYKDGIFFLPINTLKLFGVSPGSRLLAIRGSGLGLGFAFKGPIINEAEKHEELEIF